MSLSHALQAAIARLRSTLGDPVAPIAVLTPSDANGVLARQQLALAGPFIRVEFLTPERLVRDLGRRTLAHRGLRPEPAGWLSATVGTLARDLGGPYAEVLGRPGWRAALARAIDTLEAAGVDPDALEQVPVPEHAERLRILATLLRGVRARRQVDRLYAMADLCEAALPHVGDGWQGAVLLGDRLLAPRVHEVVRAWLFPRPHVQVLPPSWAALDPVPMGLRAAGWGGTHGVQTAPATTVLARTPDEVRELGEAARVVLDAIARGTPLDRIAIVLPDAEQVPVLRGHLDRAGVPATWLTGPPLSTTPAARFLVHALELASGDDTVPAWYDLLRQPGLRLRAEKRGRWRRLLSKCGAVRDTRAIVRAVSALEDEAGDGLVAAIEALHAVFEGWEQPATLGEHAQRWSRFLERWWVPSPDREQVRAALASWGSPGIGAPLPLGAALAELRDALGSWPAVEGSLSDPAVRVATPMTLLGGEFDLVAVTGLTEGRLPRRPSEDPLLPDALLEAINEALGTTLLGSRDLASFETRRFAAIVSACTGLLWLSAPATELLEERPLLPSTFLLDTASALLGRRARFEDLASLQQQVGSRARPWPGDPERAVHALEHRVATTALEPEAGLRRLALHTTAARLLGLHRALDAGVPTKWTGALLPPGMLPVPGLDGAAQAPWALQRLLENPGAFLASWVLGVRKAPRLAASSDPALPWWRDEQILAAFSEALAQPGDLRAGFEAAWDAAIDAWREHRVDVTDQDLALVRHLALQRAESLLRTPPAGTPHAFLGPPIGGLPWVLEGQDGWLDGERLTVLRGKRPKRGKMARDAADVVLIGMASPGVERLRVVTLDGVETSALAGPAAEVSDLLRAVTRDVQRGFWPVRAHGAVHLKAEPTFEPGELP